MGICATREKEREDMEGSGAVCFLCRGFEKRQVQEDPDEKRDPEKFTEIPERVT